MARTPESLAPKLLGLATALPPHSYSQEFVIDAARAIFRQREEDFTLFEPLFRNAGIGRRYSVEPYTWYLQPHDWTSRTAAYIKGAEALYKQAATAALAEAGIAAADVGTVVTVSSTGIATPSLDARMLERMGYSREVKRLPVFGLGCAGGVGGMAIASRLAAAEPGKPVLVVTIELCSLAFRLDRINAKDMVATALFGDGAAAAVVMAGADGGLATLGPSGEHTWPDTLDIMGWGVDTIGFEVILSRSIPDFASKHLKEVRDAFLGRHGLTIDDIKHPVFHPGGPKVIEALEVPMGLPAESLQRERNLLRDFGNMSAPTVLFGMRAALDEGVKGRGLLSALGPGFSASFMLCEFQ